AVSEIDHVVIADLRDGDQRPADLQGAQLGVVELKKYTAQVADELRGIVDACREVQTTCVFDHFDVDSGRARNREVDGTRAQYRVDRTKKSRCCKGIKVRAGWKFIKRRVFDRRCSELSLGHGAPPDSSKNDDLDGRDYVPCAAELSEPAGSQKVLH